MSALSVLVLAAGQGTRMKSATPKVLHRICGRPLLEHVLNAVQGLKPQSTAVVVGVGREQVRETLAARGWDKLHFAVQKEQRGSGHAVLMARTWLMRRRGTLLVVYGDTPLLTTETLRAVVREHQRAKNAATFLTMNVPDPTGYGRMILDAEGAVERIVEHKDATPDELRVRIVNSGVACWDIAKLQKALPRLRPNNAKREYYLTDAAALLREAGGRVGVYQAEDAGETQGVNNRVDLAQTEATLRRKILEHWMREGVTLIDPSSTYIESDVVLAPDVTLYPGTVIRGKSRIASFCEIGPYTVIEDAVVESGAKVGPFARLRPGAVIGENAHIGNFVEIKKTQVGKGSKVNHLTYVGDAQIGAGVNVGAGTITCNYDGFKKSQTVIEDGAFIGSNTNLVAPVRVGRGAIIGAGSTITKDVPAEALGVARARQLIKEKWAYEFRKKQKG
jgi:bifunctional UDP-N-acetylglucosamine pyrophosphorylase/glucosamine-1-phosphate N-acetyltransferase